MSITELALSTEGAFVVVDGADEAGETADKAAQRKAPTEGKAKGAKRADPVRKAIEQTLAVVKLERRQREMLAQAVGLRGYDDSDDANRARLVLAVLAPGNILGVVAKVVEIAGADALEAGVLATDLASDNKDLAAAWSVLSAVGAVSSAPPSTQAKAGLAIAKAAKSLPSQARADLAKALSLGS